MKKRIITAVLVLAVAVTAMSGMASATTMNEYREIKTYINGEYVELAKSARLINNYTYVPLRALAVALGATSVSWKDNCATVIAPNLTLTANTQSPYIVANGRYIYTPQGIKNIGGHIMVPVRAFCKAFDAEVEWNGEEMSINIVTGKGYIESGDTYYDSDDLYWLSRIINAEARGESLEGMIGVGNVVLNRVAYYRYPDTIYGVIFDTVGGVQFSPISDGSIYLTPSEKSVIAAKLVLDGADEVEECLFFSAVSDCWAKYNRTFYRTIGGHDFYL